MDTPTVIKPQQVEQAVALLPKGYAVTWRIVPLALPRRVRGHIDHADHLFVHITGRPADTTPGEVVETILRTLRAVAGTRIRII
jgi:hypothetical protein